MWIVVRWKISRRAGWKRLERTDLELPLDAVSRGFHIYRKHINKQKKTVLGPTLHLDLLMTYQNICCFSVTSKFLMTIVVLLEDFFLLLIQGVKSGSNDMYHILAAAIVKSRSALSDDTKRLLIQETFLWIIIGESAFSHLNRTKNRPLAERWACRFAYQILQYWWKRFSQ